MELIVGSLSDQPDGGLAGVLCTLTIRTQLELRPVRREETAGPPRFLVIGGTGATVGEGERLDDGFRLTILSPELSRPLDLRVRPADRGGEWHIIWSPQVA